MKTKGEIIPCPECGIMFKVLRENQRCCCPECQEARKKKMKKISNQTHYTCIVEFRPESDRQSLIDQKNEEARRRGMSYGQLMALRYIEMHGRIKL